MAFMKYAIVLIVLVVAISVLIFSIQSATAVVGAYDISGVDNFAVLAGAYSNPGGTATFTGDLGYSVAPIITPPLNGGVVFVSPAQAYLDAQTVRANLISDANAETCTFNGPSGSAFVLDTLPQPILPGVYCIDGEVSIGVGITLDGDGIYIFRSAGALNAVGSSVVTLAPSVDVNKIFWVPVGATTLNVDTVFKGNILMATAGTTMLGSNLDGRILSNGPVTTSGPSDVITSSPSLPVLPLPAAEQPKDCIDCIPPTLGLTSNSVRRVDQGFSYNGNPSNVELFITPLPLITTNIGVVNKAVFKIYEEGGPDQVRHVELIFGLANGQSLGESKAAIEWDQSWDGIETFKVVDPTQTLKDVRVEASEGACKAGATTNDCLILTVYHTFVKPLEFNMIATNVWDDYRNSWQNYFTPGVKIMDESVCTVTFTKGTVDLGSNTKYPNRTYPPGVYCIDGAANIGSGPIILTGNGAHVFKINGALTQAANTDVILSNGALASGVIWVPIGATTIGASSHLIGTVTGAPITLGANSDLNGVGSAKIIAQTISDNSACTVTFPKGAVDLGSNTKYPNRTYPPGVYCIDGAANIGSGPIILTGSGSHIFKINGALTQAANTDVILAGGALASGVIWVPAGATTIGASSHLIGTIAGAPITLGANSDLSGVGPAKIPEIVTAIIYPCTVTFPRGAIDLGSNAQYPDKTYPPGVYCIDGAANIGSGPIILTGSGAHIFKINGAFNQAVNTDVILANGALVSNLVWIPTGAITIGASSHLIGTVTGAPITLGANSDLNGIGSATIMANTLSSNSQCTVTFPKGSVDLGSNTKYPDKTYPPGVYCIDGNVNIGSGPIILTGNGAHVFKINGALTQAANTDVILANGALASGVSWIPSGATVIESNSHLIGTIAGAPITIGVNSDLSGVGPAKITPDIIKVVPDTIIVPVEDEVPVITMPEAEVELDNERKLSPLKQTQDGVYIGDIECNEGLTLIMKAKDKTPACVTPQSKIILLERGWAMNAPPPTINRSP
jgi:hypothetical protein